MACISSGPKAWTHLRQRRLKTRPRESTGILRRMRFLFRSNVFGLPPVWVRRCSSQSCRPVGFLCVSCTPYEAQGPSCPPSLGVLVFLRVTIACSSASNQLFDVFTDAVAFWKESGGNAAQQG